MEALAPPLAVEDLYREHYPRLVHTAMRYVDRRDLAEEIVQDVFLKYFAKECSPRSGAEFSYLRSMVLNMARSALRRRLVEEKHADQQGPDAVESAEALAMQRVTHDTLHRQIQELPLRQRSVIVHQHLLDQSVATIARTLGISTGSVKQHAFRARSTLHQRLVADGL